MTCRWLTLLALGFAVAICLAALPAWAQDFEESDTQAWFEYEIRNGITEKLRLSWNLGYRDLVSAEDVLGDWSRLHLQAAVVYAFSRRVSFEGGAGGYYTFREKPADPIEYNSCDAVQGNPIAE